MEGDWRSIAAGWSLHMGNSGSYSLSDLYSESCVTYETGATRDLLPFLRKSGDTLWLTKGVVSYPFIRWDVQCEPVLIDKDPLSNFRHFSRTVADHFAFMDESGLDWEQYKSEKERELVTHNQDTTLYRILSESLLDIGDNHGYLEATESYYQKWPEEETRVPTDSVKQWGDFEIAQKVAAHHFDQEFTNHSNLIRWGKIGDSTGYILVKAMWLYGDLPLEDQAVQEKGFVGAYADAMVRIPESEYIERERQGAAAIMDRAMQDLTHMTEIVIDIRFNGGGQDAVSYEILSRFVDTPTVVAGQQLFYRGSRTPVQKLLCKPSKNPYTKPVYLLLSGQTGSAAEALAVASRAIPHIKRLGSATSGALSTALERRLPNGWYFSISNEVYLDIHGNAFEGTGVPPDYQIPYPAGRQEFFSWVAENLNKDKSQILEALTQLEN